MILTLGSDTASAGALLGAASLVAGLGYLAAALAPADAGPRWRIAFAVAWLAHAIAIATDVSGFGSGMQGARFGFAPAVSMTVWMVLAVYLIESRFLPLAAPRRALAVLGIAALVLAVLFPGELRPAHAGSPWAPVHWVLGIASYGLFGAAVLHAAMFDRADRRMRDVASGVVGATPRAPEGVPLLRLERLTFRFVGAGFVVLSAALLLGWWFSAPWRWDHKTVFSLLGWGVFAALLIGRRAFGWRGRRAMRWLYVGAVLLLLAYVGSRFVMEVVLHRPVAGA